VWAMGVLPPISAGSRTIILLRDFDSPLSTGRSLAYSDGGDGKGIVCFVRFRAHFGVCSR
jgi:hypothetical protein